MARLDRLATAQAVAQLGAALGREFAYELIRAVAPLDEALTAIEETGSGGTSVAGIYPDAERVALRGTVGTGFQPAPPLILE